MTTDTLASRRRQWALRFGAGALLAGVWTVAVAVGSVVTLAMDAPVGPLQGALLRKRNALIFFASWLIVTGLLWLAARWPAARRETPARFKTWWFTATLVLGAAWAGWAVAFAPGIVTTDSRASLEQVLGQAQWSNHHPVAFTALVWACVRAVLALGGSLDLGIQAFSVVQALFHALVLGYVVAWVARKRRSAVAPLVVLLLFAADPVVAAYSVTMWKDIIFSSLVVVLVTQLWDVADAHGRVSRRQVWAMALVCFLVIMFRNNGVYVVGLVVVVLMISCGVRAWRVIAATIAAVVIGLGITGPGWHALGIKASPFTESASIPMQQLAYTVVHGDNLTPNDKVELRKIMPMDLWKQAYAPETFDSLKFHPGFNRTYVNEHPADVLLTWWSLLPAHQGDYLKGWLGITAGYWKVGETNWVIGGEDVPPKRTISSIIALPGLSLYFSIAASVWLIFVWCLPRLRRQHWRELVAVVPLLGVWLTLLVAAPTWCEFRYFYAGHLAIPLLLVTFRLAANGIKTPESHGDVEDTVLDLDLD